MLHFFDKIHKNLLKLIYPDYCAGCDNLLLHNEKIICTNCLHHLPTTLHLETETNEIHRIFYGILPIEQAYSLLYFHKNGIAQNLIHQLKYKKRQDIGNYLAEIFSSEFKVAVSFKTVDLIVPVPLHKKRLYERGYNQIDTFCQTLSQELNIPYDKDVLVRNEYLKSQTKKSKIERREVKSTLFSVQKNDALKGQHFLLVDDVLTTGATIEACAKELLSIPNAKVSILTLAYAQS